MNENTSLPLVGMAKWLLSAAFIAACAYFLLDWYAPAWAAQVRSTVSEGAAWSDAAIEKDPVAYLEHSRRRLQTQQARLGEVIASIRESIHPLDRSLQSRAEELAKTEAFLREGREAYQRAKGEEAQGRTVEGVKFAGRLYPDVPTLKAQLELLYNEKQAGDMLLAQGKQTKKRLEERLYAMLLQQGKLGMAISEIGPQIAIVQAQVSTRQLDAIIERAHTVTEGVIDVTAKMVEENGPIGTTKELIETAKGIYTAGSKPNQAFEDFLQGQS